MKKAEILARLDEIKWQVQEASGIIDFSTTTSYESRSGDYGWVTLELEVRVAKGGGNERYLQDL